MAERVTDIEQRTPASQGLPAPAPRRTRSGLIIGLVVVLAIAAVVGWALTSGNGSAEDEGEAAAALEFADVVRTDLREVSEYDGTLGSIEGDPVQAQTGGTITWLPEAGETIGSGNVLFEIDGEPVVLLTGDVPAYRTMAAIDETETVTIGRSGTVTAVPEEGTLVTQGDVLFEIDDEPVVLLYGDVPFYRALFDASEDLTGRDIAQLEEALTELGLNDGVATVDDVFTGATENLVELFEAEYGLEENGRIDAGEIVFLPGPVEIVEVSIDVGAAVTPGRVALVIADPEADGVTGTDVLQLEAALAALGFDVTGSLDVDGVFTVATRSAVEEFQRTLGADDDGVVQLGEIVFRSEPVFVSDQLLDVGSPVNPGTPVLAVASADKFVTVDLPASDQQEVAVGQAVTVELPDGTEVAGTVASKASIATQGPEGATFEVIITLDDSSAAADLDEAPVDVAIVTDSVDQVVAVPVTALLALREGGYAVEVRQPDGSTRLVAVDPGFFADGLVELESGDVAPGDQVVVP